MITVERRKAMIERLFQIADDIHAAEVAMYSADEQVLEYETALTALADEAIISGQVNGRNQDIRDLQIRTMGSELCRALPGLEPDGQPRPRRPPARPERAGQPSRHRPARGPDQRRRHRLQQPGQLTGGDSVTLPRWTQTELTRHAFHHYKGGRRKPNGDPGFLQRLCVNYQRREFTRYDEQLQALCGTAGAQHRSMLRYRVYQAIQEQYPWLKAECQLQIEERSE
jgi:hypothetical protein